MNAGVSGASPADYLYLAPTLKAAYDPSRVVVQVSDSDFGPQLTSTEAITWLEPQDDGWAVRRARPRPVSGWLQVLGTSSLRHTSPISE